MRGLLDALVIADVQSAGISRNIDSTAHTGPEFTGRLDAFRFYSFSVYV